jgi:hypothetical protein
VTGNMLVSANEERAGIATSNLGWCLTCVGRQGNLHFVQPVGDLGIAGAVLQEAKYLVVNRLGSRVFIKLGILLCAGWLNNAEDGGLHDATLLKAVSQGTANAAGGIRVFHFMAYRGEERCQTPNSIGSIHVVSYGDEPGAQIGAQLTEQVGVHTAKDPAQVLGDD